MRSRAAWARGRLRRMLVRLQENPFSSEEVLAMQHELDAIEARVEALGEVAARERADVEALEAPWRRGLLWLVGQLEQRELKERGEYEAALAAVMREGERAAALRARIQALGPQPAYSDAQVAKVIKGVSRRDLARFGPTLGTQLQGLRDRLEQADEVWWLERQAARTYQVAASGKRFTSMHGCLLRLRKGLDKRKLHRLADEVGRLAELYRTNDPSLTGRQRRARGVLMEVRAALRQEREASVRGLSDQLVQLVRDAKLPSWT